MSGAVSCSIARLSPSRKCFLQAGENALVVIIRLVLLMERIPYLGKKRIALRFLVVVPRSRQAVRAPVSAKQYKGWTGLEFMSKGALPAQLCRQISFSHGRGSTLPSSGFGCLDHIRQLSSSSSKAPLFYWIDKAASFSSKSSSLAASIG